MCQPQAPRKPGLPREATKWLQSLQLSVYPKNTRRDFSNGYLVAEIFSRYYPQDFRVHSYDKGTSLSAKQRNWSHIARSEDHKKLLLSKSLQKKNLHLTKEVIDGAIHCKPGAAEHLVQEVYTFLTNRSIRDVAAPESDSAHPDYQSVPTLTRCRASRPTDNSGGVTEITAQANISAHQGKEAVILPRHEEHQAAERVPNPESSSSSTWSGAAVSFKEIKVCQPARRSLLRN